MRYAYVALTIILAGAALYVVHRVSYWDGHIHGMQEMYGICHAAKGK